MRGEKRENPELQQVRADISAVHETPDGANEKLTISIKEITPEGGKLSVHSSGDDVESYENRLAELQDRFSEKGYTLTEGRIGDAKPEGSNKEYLDYWEIEKTKS